MTVGSLEGEVSEKEKMNAGKNDTEIKKIKFRGFLRYYWLLLSNKEKLKKKAIDKGFKIRNRAIIELRADICNTARNFILVIIFGIISGYAVSFILPPLPTHLVNIFRGIPFLFIALGIFGRLRWVFRTGDKSGFLEQIDNWWGFTMYATGVFLLTALVFIPTKATEVIFLAKESAGESPMSGWIFPLCTGIVLTAVVTHISMRRLKKYEVDSRRKEALREAYAAFFEGVLSYIIMLVASKDSEEQTLFTVRDTRDLGLCLRRLYLLERDEKYRDLIHAVFNSIPKQDETSYKELLENEEKTGKISWPPLDNAIEILQKALREGDHIY